MQKRTLLNIVIIALILLQTFNISLGAEDDETLEIRFLTPTNGDRLTGGHQQNITLYLNTSLDPANITIYIEYGYQGKGPYLITNLTGETLNYSWDVPQIDLNEVWLIVRAEHGEIKAWDIIRIDIDSTPPRFLDHYPYQGDTIFSTEDFKLIFDQRVNLDDIRNNYTVYRDNIPVSGSFTTRMDNNNFSVTFRPTTRLTVGTDYSWVLQGAIRDVSQPGNLVWINRTANFSVEEVAPRVTVLSPLKDTIIDIGDTVEILWSTDNIQMPEEPITITYTLDDGNTWIEIASNIENTGNFSWLVEPVPAARYPVYNAIINVSSVSVSGYMGYGHSQPFIIYDNYPPEVEVLRPFEGTSAVLGQTYMIRWIATDEEGLPNNPITISISTDNKTSWRVIAQSIANTGEFNWRVTGVPIGEAYINVSCKDSHGDIAWAHSPLLTILDKNPLSIAMSPLKTSYHSLERVNVSWTTPEWAHGDYRLRLLRSVDGQSWVVQQDMDSSRSYINFTMPYEISSDFRFRLEMYDWEDVIFYNDSFIFEVFPEILETRVEHIGDFTFVTIRFNGYIALGHMQRGFTLYRDGVPIQISTDDVYSQQSNVIVFMAHNLDPGNYQAELNSDNIENRNFTPRTLITFSIEEEEETKMEYWPLLLFTPLLVLMLYLYRGKKEPSSKLPDTHVKITRL